MKQECLAHPIPHPELVEGRTTSQPLRFINRAWLQPLGPDHKGDDLCNSIGQDTFNCAEAPTTPLTAEIMDRHTLGFVWNQGEIPVVLRRTGPGEKLRVRLPSAENDFEWLRNGRRSLPKWIGKDGGFWELPKAWFNDFVNRALRRFEEVYIVQPYNEQEICAPACRYAEGHICECACMGANHGTCDDTGWFDVNDAFSTRSGDRHLACRRLTVRKDRK